MLVVKKTSNYLIPNSWVNDPPGQNCITHQSLEPSGTYSLWGFLSVIIPIQCQCHPQPLCTLNTFIYFFGRLIILTFHGFKVSEGKIWISISWWPIGILWIVLAGIPWTKTHCKFSVEKFHYNYDIF